MHNQRFFFKKDFSCRILRDKSKKLKFFFHFSNFNVLRVAYTNPSKILHAEGLHYTRFIFLMEQNIWTNNTINGEFTARKILSLELRFEYFNLVEKYSLKFGRSNFYVFIPHRNRIGKLCFVTSYLMANTMSYIH